jgi:hypothetical protein
LGIGHWAGDRLRTTVIPVIVINALNNFTQKNLIENLSKLNDPKKLNNSLKIIE